MQGRGGGNTSGWGRVGGDGDGDNDDNDDENAAKSVLSWVDANMGPVHPSRSRKTGHTGKLAVAAFYCVFCQ
jgi:hypothetical protein